MKTWKEYYNFGDLSEYKKEKVDNDRIIFRAGNKQIHTVINEKTLKFDTLGDITIDEWLFFAHNSSK